MNVLTMGERVRVVSALVEGTSMRATERLTGTGRQAITDLLLRVGEGCRGVLDETMRAPARLTLGALAFELLPDGRVLATLPATALPFSVALQATVLYPSLRAFLAARSANRSVSSS